MSHVIENATYQTWCDALDALKDVNDDVRRAIFDKAPAAEIERHMQFLRETYDRFRQASEDLRFL